MKYHINLIQQIRQKEQKEQVQKSTVTVISVLAFALLFLSATYSASNVIRMYQSIEQERRRLHRIEAEYRKYRAAKMMVDKADIELLDGLQTGRVFWTKKLAAMAFHLPDSYWITRFGYDKDILNVRGYGFISPQQEQLITIDEYLNNLRRDTMFADVFPAVRLNSTSREDEAYRERVMFDYSAEKAGAKPR
jgi:hypothetical protein